MFRPGVQNRFAQMPRFDIHDVNAFYDIWPYEFPVLDERQKDGIDYATKIIPRVTECESGVGY